MKRKQIQQLKAHFERCLSDDILPFWQNHSLDHEFGGYFNCLDRDGSLYGTDKSMLLQARTVWLFSRMYTAFHPKAEWLQAAKLGYDFLSKHIVNTCGDLYFAVTRDGRPLERFFFSVDAYAVMACSEYFVATREEKALEYARRGHHRLRDLYRTPGGSYPDFFPEDRRTKDLVVPMLLAAATREIVRADPSPLYAETLDLALDHVLSHFLDRKTGVLRETVLLSDDSLLSPQGRLVVPGHGIYFSWILLEEAEGRRDTNLERAALDLLDRSIELGWDKEYGGIFNFVDIDGRPPLQLDFDMKPWWSHNEALYASLLAHHLTGDTKYLNWYERVHEYAFSRFPDPDFGEWYGYLRRDGTVSSPAKGFMWKSGFHVASSMWQCLKLLERMGENAESGNDT